MYPKRLRAELQAFYEKHADLADRELFIEIEKKFGNEITEEVCIPNKLTNLECIIAAVYMLREGKGKLERKDIP